MSDEIAFKIQLGLVLPKLEEQLSGPLTTIIEEVLQHLEAGTLEGEEALTMDDVKALLMQDLEIFLDSKVLPAIEAKRNPPEEVVEAAEVDTVAEEAAELETAETEEVAE